MGLSERGKRVFICPSVLSFLGNPSFCNIHVHGLGEKGCFCIVGVMLRLAYVACGMLA